MFDHKTVLAPTTNHKRHIPTLIVAASLMCVFCIVAPSAAQTCTSGTLNVTSPPYNAKGDGMTDDTSAIQTAINAATSGECVYFPNGTYLISSAIQLGKTAPASGFTIYGQSQTGAIIKYSCPSCSTGYQMIQLGNVGFSYTPSNITILYLTLEGNNDPTAVSGIYAYGGSNHTLQHLTIQDFPGGSTNPSPMGIHFNGPTTCTDNTCTTGTSNSHISANTITNIGTATTGRSTSTTGIRCSWGSSKNSIQNNTISNVGRDGIAGDHYSTDLTIKYNTISGTGRCSSDCAALAVEIIIGSDRTVVDKNTVDHWISIGQSSRVAVRNNTVVNGTTAVVGDIGLEFAAGNLAALTDGVFTANTVGPAVGSIPMCSGIPCGQQTVGISISNTVGSTFPPKYSFWANNVIQNMTGNSTSIANGVSMNAGSSGAPIQYHYFYNNTVVDTPKPGNGFRLQGSEGINYIALDTNTIQDNGVGSSCGFGGNGINFVTGTSADHFSFLGNTIGGTSGQGNGGYGIFGTYPTNVEWSTTNTVSGNCNNTTPTNNWMGIGSEATFTPSETIANPGDTITFTFNPASGVTFQHVIWDFDDGIPIVPGSPYTQNQTHKYVNNGTCHVSLIAWDTNGVATRYEQTIVVGGGTGNCNGN